MLINTSSTRPADTDAISIEGPAGRLQALAELPSADSGQALAVVCHPHPLYQGTMDNKVVHTLVRACTRAGTPAVRFNFRGVGDSEGVHDNGVGEIDDALAVVDWAQARWPDRELWLLGFSFGGVIAAQAALRKGATVLVTVAPAVTRLALDAQASSLPRWLIVQGEDDDVVPASAVIDWLNDAPPGPQLVTLPQAGHFFHGQLNALREIVQKFLAGADAEADPEGEVSPAGHSQ